MSAKDEPVMKANWPLTSGRRPPRTRRSADGAGAREAAALARAGVHVGLRHDPPRVTRKAAPERAEDEEDGAQPASTCTQPPSIGRQDRRERLRGAHGRQHARRALGLVEVAHDARAITGPAAGADALHDAGATSRLMLGARRTPSRRRRTRPGLSAARGGGRGGRRRPPAVAGTAARPARKSVT